MADNIENFRTSSSILLSKEELEKLNQAVIEAATIDSPQILDIAKNESNVKPEVRQAMQEMIERFDQLQHATSPDHPPVYKNTDVVMIISGPGPVKKDLGEVSDRYVGLDYAGKMNRGRVRVAVALMLEITRLRLEEKGIRKTTAQITKEDILIHGPYLHYADPPERMPNFTLALQEYYPNIPLEKVFTYDHVTDSTGQSKPIVNTSDQMHGLVLPSTIPIRRIVAIADAAHLLRAMYQLGLTPDRIPPKAILQAWPIHTPRSGIFDHTKRQMVGILASIYKLGTAANKPYPYQL